MKFVIEFDEISKEVHASLAHWTSNKNLLDEFAKSSQFQTRLIVAMNESTRIKTLENLAFSRLDDSSVREHAKRTLRELGYFD